LDAAEKELVACNHIRANKLFTASLLGHCDFKAFPCESYEAFEKATCFSCPSPGCALLGIHASQWQPPKGRKNVRMYLATAAGPDYCQYHYRLRITTGSASPPSIRGRLRVTLITGLGELEKFDLSKEGPVTLSRSSSRTFLLRHHRDLSSSRDALVQWTHEPDVFSFSGSFCALFCQTELRVDTLSVTPLDTANDAGKDIVMCHSVAGQDIRIRTDSTLKISVEPHCHNRKTATQPHRNHSATLQS